MAQTTSRKPLLAVAVFLSIVLVLALLFIFFLSRQEADGEISLAEFTPSNSLVRNRDPITLTFSKPLDQNIDLASLSLDPTVFGIFELDEQSATQITFTPLEDYVAGTTYTLDLGTVIDGTGLELRGDESVSFSGFNIRFNGLDEEEQQALIAEQEPIDQKYPILSLLPRNAPEYRLNYTFNTPDFILEVGDSQENVVELHLEVYGTFSNEIPDKYEFQLAQNKQVALDYLRDNGINPDDFTIIYTPDIARDL